MTEVPDEVKAYVAARVEEDPKVRFIIAEDAINRRWYCDRPKDSNVWTFKPGDILDVEGGDAADDLTDEQEEARARDEDLLESILADATSVKGLANEKQPEKQPETCPHGIEFDGINPANVDAIDQWNADLMDAIINDRGPLGRGSDTGVIRSSGRTGEGAHANPLDAIRVQEAAIHDNGEVPTGLRMSPESVQKLCDQLGIDSYQNMLDSYAGLPIAVVPGMGDAIETTFRPAFVREFYGTPAWLSPPEALFPFLPK